MTTYHAVAIGGKPNTGKTFSLLTAPGRKAIIYCDRPGGDIDIRELEDAGVFVYQVDMKNFRDSALAQINKVRQDIKTKGLESVCIDSFSMGQGAQLEKDTNHNRNSMNLKKWGGVGNNVLDVMDAFYGLEGVHRIGTFHIKEEPILNASKERVGTIWKPAVTPMVAMQMKVFCGLIGYTVKRPKSDGSGNTYSVCFLEELAGKSGLMRFDCAKSPEGWGMNEPMNIAGWFARIEKDAEARRQVVRDAMAGKLPPPPPIASETPEADEKDETTNELPE